MLLLVLVLAWVRVLVRVPQATGFTGPSANMLTHAYYLGKLEALWPRLIRLQCARRPIVAEGRAHC